MAVFPSMASASSYERGLILALILLFALCATFVVKHKLGERDAPFDYQDTARAKNEIDQSYVLLIAESEQNSVENEVKDHNVVDTTLNI